jgi:hypothetical protein
MGFSGYKVIFFINTHPQVRGYPHGWFLFLPVKPAIFFPVDNLVDMWITPIFQCFEKTVKTPIKSAY